MAENSTDLLTCQFNEKMRMADPIDSRLAVAKRVFTSFSIPMVRKEETAISILCQLATSGENIADLGKILNCLQECLESKKMLTYSGDFKPEVVDQLLAVFKLARMNELVEEFKVSLLRLAVALLTVPYFQRWFSCDVANFCILLGDAFSASTSTSSADVAKLLTLQSQICKLTLFKAEIRLAYLEQTYIPLCKALTVIEDDGKYLLSKIVDSVIEVVLYDSAFLEEFCMSKSDVMSSDGELPHSLKFKSLLKKEIKAAASDQRSVASVFTIFLKSSTKILAQKQNLETSFDVFTTLCSVLGCKVDKRISISWKAVKNWDHVNSYSIISKMIAILDDAEVPLSIDHGTYTLDSWFMSLVIGTLNTNLTQLSPELLNMAEMAFKYNPLIIENCSKTIAEVMLRKKPKTSTSCYISLMKTILQGAVQTQRFQKFISSLFANLKSAIDSNSSQKYFDKVVLEDLLPPEIGDSFAESAISIPLLQMLAIFKNLLDHFQQDCLRPLESNCSDNATVLLIELFSELLRQFLTSVKIADHSVPDIVKSRFTLLFEDLRSSLEKIGAVLMDDHMYYLSASTEKMFIERREFDLQNLVRNKKVQSSLNVLTQCCQDNDRILKSYLDVCHSFGAVQLMVDEYEGVPIKPVSKRDLTPLNFFYVHPYLTPKQWKQLGESVTDHDGCLARHSLYNMMVQKIEAVAQVEEGFEGPGTQTARFLIKIADTDWLWSEITGLAVLCQANELVQLVGSLIDSLGTSQVRWLQLIKDENFLENRSLVLALALQLLNKAANYIASDDDCLAKDVTDKTNMADLLEYELSLLVTDDEDLAAQIGNAVLKMKKIINERLSSEVEDKKVFLDKSFILVLHSLPLHHFSVLSQSCLFFGVLALLSQTSPCQEMDHLLMDILFRILNNPATTAGKSLLSGLDTGRIVNLICSRGTGYKSLRYFLHMICKDSLFDKKASKKLIKAVSHPTANNLWLTSLLIEAVHQMKPNKKLGAAGEAAEENFTLDREEVLNSLVRLVVPILENEPPSLELLPTFSQIVNLQLKTKNDYGGAALNKKINEYLQFCPLDPEHGIPLMETLISHRNRLEDKELQKSIAIDGWKLLLKNNQPSKLLSKINVIFTSSTDDEFQTITTDLSAQTTAAIYSRDSVQLKMLFDLWCPLVTSQISSSKSKIRQFALVSLVKNILDVLEHWKSVPNDASIKSILKFFSELACTTAVDIQPAVLDTQLVCLQSVPLPTENAVVLLENLVDAVEALFALYLFRNALILDRLHVFWPIYKNYLTSLAKVSYPQTEHVAETLSCADKLERVAKTMAKRQKDFSRIAEMFIADVISILEKHPLHPEVKTIYNNIINVFLALCDDHAISYLSFSLPPASQELFKTYHHNFKKFHKYQGKI